MVFIDCSSDVGNAYNILSYKGKTHGKFLPIHSYKVDGRGVFIQPIEFFAERGSIIYHEPSVWFEDPE